METMTKEQKYIKQLEKENNILRKKNAIYHNGLMEMQFSVCKDLPASTRLEEVISLINTISIDTASVNPKTIIQIF